MSTQPREIVGVIPMAGQATRLGALPCSKELFPIGYRRDPDGSERVKVVSHYLLDSMRMAGIERAFLVLRPGKWDIPTYYGDGALAGMNLAYLMVGLPYGPPYSIDQAYPFVKDCLVAIGFPDMICEPTEMFVDLRQHQAATNADLVLAVLPASRPEKTDMLEIDDQGRIRRLDIKPANTTLRYTWEVALWAPRFTEFMHNYLASIRPEFEHPDPALRRREIHVGHVVQAAIDSGLKVESVVFEAGRSIDTGTIDDLQLAIRDYSPAG
jgi:glucose-1-phosphate thymidylyltransferase